MKFSFPHIQRLNLDNSKPVKILTLTTSDLVKLGIPKPLVVEFLGEPHHTAPNPHGGKHPMGLYELNSVLALFDNNEFIARLHEKQSKRAGTH